MKKMKTCPSCAAVYEDHLPECPYCGAFNLKGAEAEYFEQLEDIREDMEELGTVLVQETKKEVIRQSIFLKRILWIIGGIAAVFLIMTIIANKERNVDVKAEYQWKQETFPVLNALYEEKNFEELISVYWGLVVDGRPIWDWEHADFCELLDQSLYFEEILAKESANEELAESDYTHLLYYGFRLTSNLDEELSDDEIANLTPYLDMVQDDFEYRWKFSEKDLESIAKEREKNYGVVSFTFCGDYVKKWMEQNK